MRALSYPAGMTFIDPISGDTRNWPPRPGVRVTLVRGISGTERLSDARARLDDPADPAPAGDWHTEARIAADWGLLVLAGDGGQLTVSRTEFGDAWAATFDPADPFAKNDGRWPLPGPGKFDVWYYPLIKRPAFSVFALAGPTVVSIRQGGWNLDRGFGQPAPNPVTEVEMRSTRMDGTEVSVQSAAERTALPALHLSTMKAYRSVIEQLLAALDDRSAPWQVRALDVDGVKCDVLVLDMHSDALPKEVIGPGLLAVADIDRTHITIVGDDPDTELALTRIDPDDLLGRST